MKVKKQSAHKRIRAAMIRNEHKVLNAIRSAAAKGEFWNGCFKQWVLHKALYRLEAKGRIYHCKSEWGTGYGLVHRFPSAD